MKSNQIKGVFNEIIESPNRKSAYNVFLSTENIPATSINKIPSISNDRVATLNLLRRTKDKYNSIITSEAFKNMMNELADLETTIIQARNILVTDVKLTLLHQERGGCVSDYVVARANFYNPNNVKAEIRVYLGKANEIGRSIQELSLDSKFMANAEKQLVLAMKEIINS